MIPRFLFLIGLPLTGLLVLPEAALPRADVRPPYKSPLGLAVDSTGSRAYVALHTAGALAVVDLKVGKVLHEIPVGKGPTDVIWDMDTVNVLCVEDDTILTVDLDKRAVTSRQRREDAEKYLPDRLHDEELPALEKASGIARIRAMTPTNRGRRSYHVFQRPKANVPTTQVAQGWVFTNALGFVGMPRDFAFVLDEPQRGYADPSDVVQFRDEKGLFIACSGADTVLVVDPKRLPKLRYKTSSGLHDGKDPTPYYVEDLTASRHYVVARIPTGANPRRLALSGDDKTLVVANYLGDSLTVIDTATRKVVRTISLGGPEPNAARRGEILFNSGKMTFQGQFTCASCHPDGGTDGLNWDLTRDGVGNFKNTKSLLGVRDTAPYGWEGSSPTLEDRVVGTLRTLHRHEPTDAETADLVAYLKSLPPPRPPTVPAKDLPAVARGKTLFEGKAGCVACHSRTAFDDGKTHDVGTRGPTDVTDRFDTPALRGVARTAPYLHDGRAKTLEAIFTEHNPKGKHGAAHLLSKEELADLIAYLKSL
jgi:YVTN family beta-propeller protein